MVGKVELAKERRTFLQAAFFVYFSLFVSLLSVSALDAGLAGSSDALYFCRAIDLSAYLNV